MKTERSATISAADRTTTLAKKGSGWVMAAALCWAAATPAMADTPGRSTTAQFEKSYLVFIINHHYSALRMTELAAGTDRTRDAALNNPSEGTAPSPEFGTTPAKSTDEQIRSMARQANRVQREEIGKAQHFLRDWYGMRHDPVLTAEARKMIEMLEHMPAGAQFDSVFLRSFSNHHLSALAPSLHCQVKSDLLHDGLRRYCDDIVVTQKNSIKDIARDTMQKVLGL
jgi:uncharacterized protein (DUF305 family)